MMTVLFKHTTEQKPATKTAHLKGRRILILNWRDTTHPLAGGAERYCWEIATRFVADGAEVTLFSARTPGLPGLDLRQGVSITRRGGTFTVYLRAAAFLLRNRRRFHVIIDCQNGIPFFSPIFVLSRAVTVVLVVHHVHQDQFATRFRWPLRRIGRFLESDACRWIYGRRPIVAVSPCTRADVRTRLRLKGPIFVVPNGVTLRRPPRTSPRSPHPRLIFVGRLVAHKRLHLLIHAFAEVRRNRPDVSLDVVGFGPDQESLEALVERLELKQAVRFWGRVSDQQRAALMAQAWLLVSTSLAEGWGLTVIEANGEGRPALALRAPGLVDSIVTGINGWLVDTPSQLPDAIDRALSCLARARERGRLEASCLAWARRFTWARTAERVAEVIEVSSGMRLGGVNSDVATVIRLEIGDGLASLGHRGSNWQWDLDGSTLHMLLPGRDTVAATAALEQLGLTGRAEARAASTTDLLLGPGSGLEVVDGTPLYAASRE